MVGGEEAEKDDTFEEEIETDHELARTQFALYLFHIVKFSWNLI